MTLYKYIGVKENGKTCRGFMEENNKDSTLRKLREEGIYPIDIRRKVQIIELAKARKLSYRDIAELCNNLHTAFTTGLSIEKSLNLVYEKESKAEIKEILKEINKNIFEGKQLSTVLRDYGRTFPRLMTSMITIGERSGTMDSIFLACSDYYTKLNDFKKKIKGACVYPLFTISTALVVFLFIIKCVLPTLISSLYEDTAVLPWITKFMMSISSWLNLRTVSIAAVVTFLAIIIIKNKNKDNDKKASIRYRLPMMRKINMCIDNYILMYSLSVLVNSGINIIEAVDIAALTVEKHAMRRQILLCIERLKKGDTICEAFEEISTLSKYDLSMIDLGQESGKIDYMFKKLSEGYFQELNDKLEFMKKIIEPVLILFVGVLVLIIVMSVYLPILNSMENII